MAEINEEGKSPLRLDLSKLAEGFKITKPDKKEIEVKPEKEKVEEKAVKDKEIKESQEDDSEEIENEVDSEEQSVEYEDEGSEDESDESEDSNEEEESYSDEDEESEEDVEEGDESDEELESDESEEELEYDESDEELETEVYEFDVSEFTEGVFESKDDLKKTSKLLKENPQLKQMLEFYEENGTLLPWLQATQINVDDFSDIDVLREKFKSENSDLSFSTEELNELFEEEVLSKYNLDSDDEDRARIGVLRLKRDASAVKKDLKEEQSKFLLPIERDAKETALEAVREQEEKLKSHKNKLGFQIRKQVKDGKIDLKVDGENSIKMKVSPKKISSLLSTMQSVELFMDEKGEFDLRRMAMMTDPDAFISSIRGTYKTEGKKDFISKELKNRTTKKKQPTGTKPKSNEKLDPKNIMSFKGAKITRITRN